MNNHVFSLPILIYDDQCTLCVRFKNAIERVPGTEIYQKISIHNDDLYIAFPQLDREQCHQVLHLIDIHKNIIKGPEAIKSLIGNFPGIKKFSWLIESKMGDKAISYFYQMSNTYRESLLNKCTKCKKT